MTGGVNPRTRAAYRPCRRIGSSLGHLIRHRASGKMDARTWDGSRGLLINDAYYCIARARAKVRSGAGQGGDLRTGSHEEPGKYAKKIARSVSAASGEGGRPVVRRTKVQCSSQPRLAHFEPESRSFGNIDCCREDTRNGDLSMPCGFS